MRFAEEEPETAFPNAVLRLARDRVNWAQVACLLLRRFSLPVLVASPEESLVRLRLWVGNVN